MAQGTQRRICSGITRDGVRGAGICWHESNGSRKNMESYQLRQTCGNVNWGE